MGITRTHTGRTLADLPRRFLDAQAEQMLASVALTIVRTRAFDRGVGLDDRPHLAYTPAYARSRARQGRRVSPPDYTMTGRLRRSVRSVSRRQGARVRIRLGTVGQRAIVASVLNRRGAGWLGLSPSDRPKFAKLLRIAIAQTRARQVSR